MYYYQGKPVSNVRFYKYGGQYRTEFVLDGKKMNVASNEVTTEKPDFTVWAEKEDVVEATHVPEKVETAEETVEETVEEENVEEFQEEVVEEEALTLVKIENSSSGKVTIVDFDSAEFTDLVEKKDWDLDAIERVLNGEQKTHKGHTFEWQ